MSPSRSSSVIQVSRSPIIPNWFLTTLFKLREVLIKYMHWTPAKLLSHNSHWALKASIFYVGKRWVWVSLFQYIATWSLFFAVFCRIRQTRHLLPHLAFHCNKQVLSNFVKRQHSSSLVGFLSLRPTPPPPSRFFFSLVQSLYIEQRDSLTGRELEGSTPT